MNKTRMKEIQVRLKEIRIKLNYSRVHNTEPLSTEEMRELFEEENELINEYCHLFD